MAPIYLLDIWIQMKYICLKQLLHQEESESIIHLYFFLELRSHLYNEEVKIYCEATPGISNPNYLQFSKGNEKNIFIEYRNGWFYKYFEDDEGKEIDKNDLINLLKKDKFIKNIKLQ